MIFTCCQILFFINKLRKKSILSSFSHLDLGVNMQIELTCSVCTFQP
eukprot:04300.XXX_153737_153877_1 [CDS] Oithona nana genome sequencing.